MPSDCVTLYYCVPDDQLFLHPHHVARTERSRCSTLSLLSVRTQTERGNPVTTAIGEGLSFIAVVKEICLHKLLRHTLKPASYLSAPPSCM